MLYNTEDPSITWFEDKNGNNVFVQNLECLVTLDKHHNGKLNR